MQSVAVGRASSRWMPIVSSLICVLMAVFGSIVIPWLPKLLVGSTVFLSTLIVVFNLLSDILAAWMNPRLRSQFGAAE